MSTSCWLVLVFFSGIFHARAAATDSDSPPKVLREFRGAWVATVANLDWPSKPGLSTSQQQAELLTILDRAVQLRLNALILQVRPACDALYSSSLEPWSEFLSGKMGQAPEPYYDPLAFAVEQAHRRGLELHAWFNPFRVRAPNPKTGLAANHVSRTHPDWVRSYGSQLWLDPGLPAVQSRCLEVIHDVVRRYDIDGVHLDDYFYPYPEKGAGGQWLDFPDEPSWLAYQVHGGKLNRAEWRRQNIDQFVQRLYQQVKDEKRWVKVGISPFGIWRPGCPPQIKGLDAYERLYADSRKWLQLGWVDYLSPQLYWDVARADRSYGALLNWWATQNTQARHLWPGNDLHKVGAGWPSSEIVQQLRLTRKEKGPTGNVLFSMSSLMQNNDRVADALAKQFYAAPALVPPSPWLSTAAPSKPQARIEAHGTDKSDKVNWNNTGSEPVRQWLYQARCRGRWTTTVFGAEKNSVFLPHSSSRWFPDLIAITGISRSGMAGPTTFLHTKRTEIAGVQ